MKVYLVEDCGNSPGKIYAVFATLEDAQAHCESPGLRYTEARVVERSLIYGQAPHMAFNP